MKQCVSRVPSFPNLSLRAERGNLVAARAVATSTRSPRRCAPRDDKLGTRESSALVAGHCGLNYDRRRFAIGTIETNGRNNLTRRTKALVTGGAGFIGSHLVDGLLDSGYDVAVVDNLSSGQLRNLNHQATFYHAELKDARLNQIIQRERPEIVFHLAAQSSVRQSALDPVADADANVMGTIRLIAAAASEGVEKIIFSSTGGAIYGDPETIPCDEDTPVNPLTPYALSKYVGEQYLELFHDTYGLDYTILRYANVYGPGQNPDGEAGVIAIFTGMMLSERRPQIFGDGLQERDFVYVSDVVQANLAVVNKGHGRTYNIGTGQQVSVAQIYEMLQRITGFEQEPDYRPRRTGEVRHIALDSTRAEAELKWKPQVPLEEGLRRSVDYVRASFSQRANRVGATSERRRQHANPTRAVANGSNR